MAHQPHDTGGLLILCEPGLPEFLLPTPPPLLATLGPLAPAKWAYRDLRDLWFCAAPVEQCVSQYVQTLSAELLVLLSKSPFPHLFLFWSFGHWKNFLFPDFSLTIPVFFVCDFIFVCVILLETCVPYLSYLWGWPVCIQISVWQNACVMLQCCVLCWNFLYMWHSHRTNAWTICPITFLGYCWEPESVPVVSSPLEDVLAKHCHGPCDIPLHLLLYCW